MRWSLDIFLLGFAAPTLAVSLAGILNLKDSDVIPGKYIISLRPGTDAAPHLSWVRGVHRRSSDNTAGLEKTFDFGGFSAYAGEFDDETILEILGNENVLHVEADRAAYLTSATPAPQQQKQQTNAPWGLEALSSRLPLSDGNIRGHTYTYDESAGEGTYAYVLDSGVLTNNSDFGGRAVKGFNAWNGVESFDDHFGHGTHVAGTIASNTYGVAKKATVVDVKVVRGFGYSTVAHVLEGITWVVANATGTPGRAAKSVINMSLAFTTSATLNAAVDAASTMGILSVVGAGNDAADASTRSPASASTALTVGAVSWNRARASFSNYGAHVAVFAPGVDIASLYNVEGQESISSGTSSSSPHVAGLVLYLKGLEGSSLDLPAAAVKRVRKLAIADVVADAGTGTSNLLAYNGIA